MKILRYLFFFLILLFATFISYQLGTKKDNLNNKNTSKKCPFNLKDKKGILKKYYQNSFLEANVSFTPEIIENPKIIKLNEPFNFFEFEKNLYKTSVDKGWSERNFDVDGDEKEERIISANIAMNHAPHIALVIKNDKIIFKAEGTNVWIEKVFDGNGFVLKKTIDWITGEEQIIRYFPKDGGFIPLWKQKSCRVSIN